MYLSRGVSSLRRTCPGSCRRRCRPSPLRLIPHDIQAPREIGLQAQLVPQDGARLVEPLHVLGDVPPDAAVLLVGLLDAASDDVDHDLVEAGVEHAAGLDVGVVVVAFLATVGVEVAGELDEKLEGERGAVREGGERRERGEEGEEWGGEGGGGEVGGEGVLEAVEVVVEDRHFAVEMVGEGLGAREGAGGEGVDGGKDGRGEVWVVFMLVYFRELGRGREKRSHRHGDRACRSRRACPRARLPGLECRGFSLRARLAGARSCLCRA